MTACSLAAEKLLVGKGRFSDNAVVFIIDIEKVFVLPTNGTSFILNPFSFACWISNVDIFLMP